MKSNSKAYLKFLASKTAVAIERGAEFTHADLNPILKPHQGDLAIWAVRGGNRAIFSSFGTGKTLIQIQILHLILSRTVFDIGRALIVCPLGVKGEFHRDALKFFGIEIVYVRTNEELAELTAAGHRYFVTNYERVRDGDLDPNLFDVVTLDEASVLRSYGSKTYQTFLTLFDKVPFKFVCTATPSPNRFKELIHYAAFLGVMDSGQALTRWFKRDSQSAGNLTIHPHKEREFWLWVSTWATFLTKPSDLGYDDTGYDLPPVKIIRHRLPVDHSTAGFDSWGQGKLLRDAAASLSAAAREKRDSLQDRVQRAREIVDAEPGEHWLIWHELEDERRAIEKAFAAERDADQFQSVWGTQKLEPREQAVADFTDGAFSILSTKPSLCGSGCNFQRHCARMIFTSLNYKANDFMQAWHRLVRYLQTREVEVHLIYTESEDPIYDELMRKIKQHEELVETMKKIIRANGLNNAKAGQEMKRSIGIQRQQEKGDLWTAVNNDNVLEMATMPENSVDLVVTSWPFSNHYEYTASFNDFGHNTNDDAFFTQMDFLTPHMVRTLKPGRMYCVHCKDRLLYGSVTNLGMYSVNPFSDKCVAHLQKHGLIYCGRITVVTDVVRENSQTYRLGWSENAKDGTKMGVGSPEYILLFRKLPSDLTNAYADEPVAKPKDQYTRSRWQFDASPFWRSCGDRFLTPEQIKEMPQTALRAAWHAFDQAHVYDFGRHVEIAEHLERDGLLPSSFMLLDPTSHSDWVWDDVVRMRTLNTDQARKRVEGHICPLQFDVVDRLIERYSNPGDLVLDPFGGLMTVPYRAVLKGRKGLGIELNSEYWADGVGYCRAAEYKITAPTLFDLTETTVGQEVMPCES